MALSRHLISTTPVMLLWLLAAVAAADSYGGAGDGATPPPTTTLPVYEKPSLPYRRDVPEPLIIAVEGVVSCKTGSKYRPLKGVIARITCMAVNEKGNEMAPFSFPTFPTDDHGYFLATLSPSKLKGKAKVTQCKAFLPPSSSCADCKYLTNVNNAVTGASFRGFRILAHKKMKLYSVGPFFYSSQPSTFPLPDGY